MTYRFDLHVRLEAVHSAHDPVAVREALRAQVHDPLWFLGRQWQLGEHDGSDAASPALVHATVTETPITGRSAAPEDDPRNTPPEAIVESEAEQWWTVGRRVRVGQALRSSVPQSHANDATLLLAGVPPPYDALNATVFDGLQLSRKRVELGLADSLFIDAGVPAAEPRDDWDPSELAYSATFAAGATTLRLPSHDGGEVDWYSVTTEEANDATPAPPPVVRTSYPTRMSYDGAPHPRWWQIERPGYDPGAVAPHRTELASLLMVQLTASHDDEWFTAPLVSPTGSLVAISEVQVDDVMGLSTTLRSADDWTFYRVSGRGPNELLVWPTAESPLRGTSPLDEVLLGVDEDANVIWAIEERVDGHAVVEPEKEPDVVFVDGEGVHGEVVVSGPTRYRYVPSTAVPRRWHPYLASDAGGVMRFVQGRLADLTTRPVTVRPGPTSRLLRDPAATAADPVHALSRHAVQRDGLRLERRHILGRRVDGQPALWVQRRRSPLAVPPASEARFDVLDPVVAVE